MPRSPLHSHPEGHFHVLPSPDLHLIIIGTDVLKVGLGDGEEATSKRRGPGETEEEACAFFAGEEQEAAEEGCLWARSLGLLAHLPFFLGQVAPLPLSHLSTELFALSFSPSNPGSKIDVIIITLL